MYNSDDDKDVFWFQEITESTLVEVLDLIESMFRSCINWLNKNKKFRERERESYHG